MISDGERACIAKYAYVPEHLPHYASAIAQTEPFLVGDYVVHVRESQLVFVGYPLGIEFEEAHMLAALGEAKARFEPQAVSVLAPSLPGALENCEPSPPDEYYRLDLSQSHIPKKTRNMLARARGQVSVAPGVFGKEHQRLVQDFLRSRPVEGATRRIFTKVGAYAQCDTAVVFEARSARGELVAYDIGDFGASGYAFYMFNFRSRKHNLPGVSDLLLAHIIERAQSQGQRYLNLGLGIDPGISFFKKKWGAQPFLKHSSCVQSSMPGDSWSEVLDRFSRL
jgi:hypothetical protein